MNSALAVPSLRFTIVVHSGPDQGSTYQLLPPRVTIGRGPENDISLKDPRCSREHAIVEFKPTGIFVRDLSNRKTMSVNGQKADSASLKHGDVIILGDTQMIFNIDRPHPESTAIAARAPGNPPHGLRSGPPQAGGAGTVRMGPSPSERTRSKSPTNNSRLRFYIIVGVIAALFIYLLNQEEGTQTAPDGIRSTEDIQREVEASEARQETLRQRRSFSTPEEETRFREAQSHYLQGFRDYQKGMYGRAMESFQTARAIDPKHELAARYFDQASRRRDEQISMSIVEGRRYKEKQMHARCSGAMSKVIDALRRNPQDPRFKEAVALKTECDLLAGGGL